MTQAAMTADNSYANKMENGSRWTKLNTIVMIVGFIVFWPVGLAMLAYILWADRFTGPFATMRDKMDGYNEKFAARRSGCGRSSRRRYSAKPTGNRAFDEYRATKLAELEEERRRIDGMAREFDEYVENLSRAKDQKEFDKFMKSRQANDVADDNMDV